MKIRDILSTSSEVALPLLKSLVPGMVQRRGAVTLQDTNGVQTVAYDEWPSDGPLIPAWADLVTRISDATVFQTPEWQNPVLKWSERLGRLFLLAVWRGPKLLAVLPLQERRGNRLESSGAIVSDYLDPLIDPAESEAAWRAILATLRKNRPTDIEVTFRNVRHDALCRQAVPALACDEGFSCEESIRGDCSFLPLPKTWDEYLGQLKSGDRKELRRKINKAQTQAGAKLVCATDPRQSQSDAERVFSFIEAGGGERGIKCKWMLRGLLESSGETLARSNWMRVFSLHLGERHSAGVIAFRSRGGWMTWATGYDTADSVWSPGIVTFAMAIRRSIEDGNGHMDLLRGHSDYKQRLGGQPRPLYQLTLRTMKR